MPVMVSETLLGQRVVVRYRRPEPGEQPPLSDVVGVLTGLTDDVVTLATRTGTRTVPRAAVVAARAVAPSRAETLELERISRLGWRAATRTEQDGWLLYADQGWTGRANSALPLATPTRPLDEQLAGVERFYAERGLTAQIQVPMPARELLDAELARRGWTRQRPTVTLTRSLTGRAAGEGDDLDPPTDEAASDGLRLATEPDDDWVAAYHYRGGRLPDFARDLLTRHELVTFAAIRRDGRTVTIGRGVVDEGWLGITAVEVDPAYRRQGLAVGIMRGLLGWGRGHGAHDCYLQVDETNTAALALYARLGFTEHHRYHYRLGADRERRPD